MLVILATQDAEDQEEHRDLEDRGSKPAKANRPQNPISKKPFTKKGLVEWLKV
jgi:hypothetical protein